MTSCNFAGAAGKFLAGGRQRDPMLGLARNPVKTISPLSGGCDSSSVLPLPAPAKQTQRAEAGGEERESGGKRSSGGSSEV